MREAVSGPEFDAPLREAVEDLIRKSKVDVKVTVPTNLTAHVTILSETERDAILLAGPPNRFQWSTFFYKFPGARGTTWISRIGLDSKRTVAILDVTASANGGGGTRFYVLRRQDKGWRVTGESVLGFENRYGLAKPDAASHLRLYGASGHSRPSVQLTAL